MTDRRPRVRCVFDDDSLSLGSTPVRCYETAPGGQRFYAVQWRMPPPQPVVTHINLIVSWFEELKAKVPTGR